MRPIAFSFFAGLVLFAAACSSTDHAGSTPTPSPDAGNGTPTAAPPLPPELDEIMNRVAEIRGLEPPPGLFAELVARADLPALLDDLITAEDRALMAKTTTLYRLLGHFTPDQDYLTLYQGFGADSVLGLYSPIHDTLWVVYDGDESPGFGSLSRSEEETLAHEFIHALQDYHFDLDSTYDQVADSPDRSLAWTVVVEGDASYHDREYGDRYLHLPSIGGLYALARMPQVTDVPVSFIRELLFPYTSGATFAGDIVATGGTEAIDALLAEPPAGTVCVLHPGRCYNGFTPTDVSLPSLLPVLGEVWEHEWGATLGEFHLGNFLDLQLPLAEAKEAAEGWYGDTFDVYVDGEQSLALVQVEFTSEDEAAAFRQALEAFSEGAGSPLSAGQVRTANFADGRQLALLPGDGTAVTFAISSTAGPAEAALAALRDA